MKYRKLLEERMEQFLAKHAEEKANSEAQNARTQECLRQLILSNEALLSEVKSGASGNAELESEMVTLTTNLKSLIVILKKQS